MRVLVVGGGAREHALAWKLSQSPGLEALFVAPGNAGTAEFAINLPVATNDIDGLTEAAERHRIDLTVIGPEEPLARGIVDRFTARGLRIVGPTAAAAGIESSKVWAKEIMAGAGVPTARATRFTDLAAALDVVADAALPLVVKASGLAAGKGVIVAETRHEAARAVRSMLADGALGEAGREILVEEYLTGHEVSLLALTDGETTYPLIPACDYKRIGEGDVGPNTGGMGAYAPVPAIDPGTADAILRQVIRPTLAELARRGHRYRGVLYAGLILTPDGPKVLEFNCRLGDPEAEVILPLLDADLLELMAAVADGRLGEVPAPAWHPGVCVGVVLASGGYPGAYQTGRVIEGLDRLPDGVLAFHAGTAQDAGGRVVTAGGRVLALVARGAGFDEARRRVYAAAGAVTFPGAYFRHDIAAREIGA